MHFCRVSCLGHEEGQSGAHGKASGVRVEADHPVEDHVEYDRGDEEEGQLGELLGDEVHVDAVHVVLLLTQEDGDLGAEDVGHRHHVDEGECDEGVVQAGVDVEHVILLHCRERLAEEE